MCTRRFTIASSKALVDADRAVRARQSARRGDDARPDGAQARSPTVRKQIARGGRGRARRRMIDGAAFPPIPAGTAYLAPQVLTGVDHSHDA